MKTEARYLVFKLKDLNKYLSESELIQLDNICNKVFYGRLNDFRDPEFNCVVIEEDWPEFKPTWKLLEERVDSENSIYS